MTVEQQRKKNEPMNIKNNKKKKKVSAKISKEKEKEYDGDKYSKSGSDTPSTNSKRKKLTATDFIVFWVVLGLIVGGALYPSYQKYGMILYLGFSWYDYDKTALEWRQYLDEDVKSVLLIGGPHRAGMTILWDTLNQCHNDIIGFGSTLEIGSEGIAIQDVYPSFGFTLEVFSNQSSSDDDDDDDAMVQYYDTMILDSTIRNWNASHPLLQNEQTLAKLMNRFAPYWDYTMKKKKKELSSSKKKDVILMEKSPPNAILSTFLEGLYNMPISDNTTSSTVTKFLWMTRHPIANVLSIAKQSTSNNNNKVSLDIMFQSYIKQHEYMQMDEYVLKSSVLWIRLEDFVQDPMSTLHTIFKFLDLPPSSDLASLTHIDKTPNAKYQHTWCHTMDFEERDHYITTYNPQIQNLNLGYDLNDYC